MIPFRLIYPPRKYGRFQPALSGQLDYALSQVEKYRQQVLAGPECQRQWALVGLGYWRYRLTELQKQILQD